MTTARVVAVMLDGTKHEAVGVYMPLSDRVAFERKYDASVLDMSRLVRDNLDGEGNPIGPVDSLREERSAFFTWRLLRRAEAPIGDFDAFLDGVESLTIDLLEGEADPTVPGLLPGTSPS